MKKTVYCTDYPGDCRTYAVDGMTLTFHRPSGTTHFLDSPVLEMLELLAAAPDDPAGLTHRLCADLQIVEDHEALEVVEARIAELLSAGLIRLA